MTDYLDQCRERERGLRRAADDLVDLLDNVDRGVVDAARRLARVDEDPALVLGAVLDDVTAASDRLDESARLIVATMREHGASWSTIGAALGVSKQGAAKRFGEPRPPATEPGASLLDVLGEAGA